MTRNYLSSTRVRLYNLSIDTQKSVLAGIKVLEIGDELGEWCGKLLADMGAEVIKIEPDSGSKTRRYDPFYNNEVGVNKSLYYWHYNTSKKSITLDLNNRECLPILEKLIQYADVIIDSTYPSNLDALNLEYEACKRINETIVLASITPFGKAQPYSDHQSTDLTALAFGGPVWSSGYDDHSISPIRGEGNQGYQTACHYACIAIMSALVYRQFTGIGQYVETNMHAALNVTTEGSTYNYLVAGEVLQRQTGRHASVRTTPQSQTMCKDGIYINLGFPARTEEQWFHLLSWLEEEDLIDDLGDYLSVPNWDAMRRGDTAAIEQQKKVMQTVSKLAAKLNAYDMFRKAQSLGFQWGIIYSPEEVLNDPHFKDRGFPVEVDHPEVDQIFIYPGAPYKLPESPWKIQCRAPLLGEHNQEIYLQKLEFDEGKYKRFKDLKVI